MTEYRKARPDEREACIELANYVFSCAHNPHDFESLIPKVYGEGVEASAMHRVAADGRGRLRGLVGVMPGAITVAGHTLRTGFVGTVSVHPKARGEGHMKRLMDDWLAEMRETCDIGVLGGQRQRYEYFGFTHGGVCFEYAVNPTNIRHALGGVDASGVEFRPLFEVDGGGELAARLHAARPAYVHRDARPLSEILVTFRQRPLAILDRGRPIGCMIVNEKGDEVSELAAERESDLGRIVKAYLAHTTIGGVRFIAAEYDLPLHRCLGGFAEDYSIQAAAMFNIFDFANVLEAYLLLKQNTVGLSDGTFAALLDGQPVTATVKGDAVAVERTAPADAPALDKLQAQLLLLTPQGRYMDVPAPLDWFPLPLFWHTVDQF